MSAANDDTRPLSPGFWVYRLAGPAQWVRVSQRTFNDFVWSKAALPPTAGYVHIAILEVWNRDRRPARVHEPHYTRYRVTARGTWTPRERTADMSAVLASVWEREARTAGPIVHASGRFEAQRRRWSPAAADIAALRALVHERFERANATGRHRTER